MFSRSFFLTNKLLKSVTIQFLLKLYAAYNLFPVSSFKYVELAFGLCPVEETGNECLDKQFPFKFKFLPVTCIRHTCKTHVSPAPVEKKTVFFVALQRISSNFVTFSYIVCFVNRRLKIKWCHYIMRQFVTANCNVVPGNTTRRYFYTWVRIYY